MVQIHVKVKQDEEKQFLYDCPSTSVIDEVSKAVIEISNLQTQIQCLVLALEPRLLQLRDGEGTHPNAAIPLVRALSEAKIYASKDQVLNKKFLSPHVLRDHIQTIEREIMVNLSMGLSDFIQLQQLFSGSSTDLVLLQEDATQLWWAGKELMRNKQLCDYVGKNEKTKIILRLQQPSLSSASTLGQEIDSSNPQEAIKVDQPR